MKKIITVACLLLSIFWSSAQNGLDFDGTDDFVQTNYTGVLGSLDRTFEAWVYVPSNAPASNLAILDYGVNIAGSRNTFQVDAARALRFISGGTNANIATDANVVPVDEWTHVAFVLEGGVGLLYVNGAEMGAGLLTSVDTPSGAQNVKIGERVDGGSIPFHGSLDEIRIWDIAVQPEKIQSNMNMEFCVEHTNLQLYLKFNEGTAGGDNVGITTAVDESGNFYNGTLNNFGLTGATSNWVNGSGISSASNSTSFLQQSACNSFSLTANSMVYTTSGVYTEVLAGANAQGCDSIVTLDLTIDSVNTSVTQDLDILTAEATGVTYQWLECAGMTPISGATSQSYTATAIGDYAVIVTNNLCSDTSVCYTVSTVGTIENEFGHNFQIFPNPTNGEFSIDMGANYNSTTVTIVGLNGELIWSNTYSNRQMLNLILKEPSGVYWLIIESENKKAIIRLVKH